MKSFYYHGPEDIRLKEVPIPLIKDDEILVKVKAAIFGGSSYKTILRGHPVLINKKLPSPIGHQFSGEVFKVGKKVRDYKVKDRVVVLNSAPCFKCMYCKDKKYNLCNDLYFLNGAFSEYIKVPAEILNFNTFKIPKNINFKLAALTESLSVVLHGIDKSDIQKGQIVCVIGTGSIGLLFTYLLKFYGCKVLLIGRNKKKLEAGKKFGADFVISGEDKNLTSKINKITKTGIDIVVEAVGQKETWELATRIVKKGGLINFFGGCKKNTKFEIDTYRLHYEELKLVGVFHHLPQYSKKAINLLSGKKFKKLEKLMISKELSLFQLNEAFKNHQEGKTILQAIIP